MLNRVPTVDVAEAHERVAGGAMLLDVRRSDEWQAGHAPDATHIPLDALPDRTGDLPTDREVVAVCRSGARSGRATQYLRRLGLDVVNLGGGMQAWERAGGAVVREDGGRGYVA